MNPDGLLGRFGKWLLSPPGLIALSGVAIAAAAALAIPQKRHEEVPAPASAGPVDPLLTSMVELVPAGLHGEPAYVLDQRTGHCFITSPSDAYRTGYAWDAYRTGYAWVPCDGLPGVPPGGPPERTVP